MNMISTCIPERPPGPPCIPCTSSGFEDFRRSRSSLSSLMMPFESHIIIFLGLTPTLVRIDAILMLAAPAPIMVTCIWSSSFPTSLAALRKPATSTVAVPCWSSCQTGIFISFLSRSSISKHRGVAISSRFIPPDMVRGS